MDEKQWKGGKQKFCVDTMIMLDIFIYKFIQWGIT